MAHFTTLSPSWDILLSLKSFFPGISGTVYLYLNYSEFFSLFMTLVQWHLSCSVVFLWSVDTIFIPRKTGTCKQSYSPTRTCGRATLGLKPWLRKTFLYQPFPLPVYRAYQFRSFPAVTVRAQSTTQLNTLRPSIPPVSSWSRMASCVDFHLT